MNFQESDQYQNANFKKHRNVYEYLQEIVNLYKRELREVTPIDPNRLRQLLNEAFIEINAYNSNECIFFNIH